MRSTRSARAATPRKGGADVSREGVQRDLLPLIEGTTVSTKHGPVKTDHILFIASGAFHVAKPSDLLPELQGRLPIRVELKALSREDMRRILTEPEASLIKQYVALLATEKVTLTFTDDAIDALADVAVQVNSTVENIGARRLQTVMERVLDEISFDASDKPGGHHHRCRLRQWPRSATWQRTSTCRSSFCDCRVRRSSPHPAAFAVTCRAKLSRMACQPARCCSTECVDSLSKVTRTITPSGRCSKSTSAARSPKA